MSGDIEGFDLKDSLPYQHSKVFSFPFFFFLSFFSFPSLPFSFSCLFFIFYFLFFFFLKKNRSSLPFPCSLVDLSPSLLSLPLTMMLIGILVGT